VKLWVISDLHLECDHFVMPDPLPEADVCVVAGDILPGPLIALGYLERFIGKYMPVVCTLGNHDFYSHSLLEGSEWARKRTLKSKRVHLLDNSSVVMGDVRFLGCTLWTDYELDGDATYSMSLASLQISDHHRILWRRLPEAVPFTPDMARREHMRSRAWLTGELLQPFDGRTVVVTHHGPHPGSVHPRYENSAVNGAFVSDLSSLIKAGRPDLWVHGHVHDTFDYRVGSTRVVANPKGYRNENPLFDPAMVIDV